MKTSKSLYLYFFLSILFLLIGAFLGLILGAKTISLHDIWTAFLSPKDILEHQLILDVRLPRMLCTLLVGGLLGISGTLMQKVTRNPIAEPSILGISQGATLALSLLYVNTAWVTSSNILLASFLGAMIAGSFVIAFTTRNPSNLSMGRLLLAGTAMSTFFLSLSTVISLLTNQSQMIGFLVGGGFRNTSWLNVIQLFIVCIIATPALIYLSPKINTLALGDELCIGLGEQPGRIRFMTLLLIVPFTAVCVAVAKNISFVGLIIPAITSRMVSKDVRILLPCSFLAGSILLVFADTLARMLLSPYETPIGIFTSLLGIPFFLYLIRKERG